MKGTLIIVLSIVFALTTGCVKSKNTPIISEQGSNANKFNISEQTNLNTIKPDSTYDVSSVADEETIDNPFFFKSNLSQFSYKGNFLFDDVVEKDVKLYIREVTKLKHGKLYELKFDSVEGVPDDRLSLGFLYVKEDKIYKIDPTEENLNMLIEKGEVPNDSAIICQNEAIKDTLSEDEQGWHQYLDINGDIREYHSYNNQVETGFYESFVWERNKGLIKYRSGFGAERDSIELRKGQSK